MRIDKIDKRWGIPIGIVTIFAFLGSLFRGTPPGLAASEKYIKGLNPQLQKRARQFIIDAYAAGICVIITSGYRDYINQQGLYDQGRTVPGNIVTNALPGDSWHNYGLAFDVAILVNDKLTWPVNTDPVWKKLGIIGAKLGLVHGISFGDAPHFDFHPNLTLAQAKAGQQIV